MSEPISTLAPSAATPMISDRMIAGQTRVPLSLDKTTAVTVSDRATPTRMNSSTHAGGTEIAISTVTSAPSMKATAATWSYDSFRIRGGSWLIAPTPTAGQTIAYEYVTSDIGTDATGATPRAAFTVDTDLTYWDDELMVLGIAMNVLDIDGNDYAEKSYQFQARKAKLLSLDGGSRIISPYTRVDKIPQAPRIPDRLVFS